MGYIGGYVGIGYIPYPRIWVGPWPWSIRCLIGDH